MEEVGFIGLGIMGAPMANNLIADGKHLAIFDIASERLQCVAGVSSKTCQSALEVAQRCSIIFLMVGDQKDVELVLFGSQGAKQGLNPGDTVVIMSSIPAAEVRAVAQRLQSRGVAVLDAPVSGGRDGAVAGSLAIMVGGDKQGFQRVEPYLHVMGDNVTLVGELGCGQTAKAANQIIVALTRTAVGEALLLAAAAGAEPEKVRQALMGGHAQSSILQFYGARMAARENPIEFSSTVIRKDLTNIATTARELGLKLPFTELVESIYRKGQ